MQPTDSVVITSYHFAAAHSGDIAAVPWDLVVIDEAHRLRNVYKSSAKIANAIRSAVRGRPLLLLTATPLQNDLLELYGLVSFIDEHVFGDVEAFRARYKQRSGNGEALKDLRERLRPICQRTLRRQVAEYVRFTNRIPITQDFTPTQAEQDLYERVSRYLQRDKLHALPAGQRKLMTLVLRKLLASSTHAIAATLQTLANRLRKGAAEAEGANEPASVAVEDSASQSASVHQHGGQLAAAIAGSARGLYDDYETVGELADEWEPDEEQDDISAPETDIGENGDVEAEIRELEGYSKLASSITENAKGRALLAALAQGFAKLQDLGAARKVVIFTESRRTQEYLYRLLQDDYAGRTMTINGSNTDERLRCHLSRLVAPPPGPGCRHRKQVRRSACRPGGTFSG